MVLSRFAIFTGILSRLAKPAGINILAVLAAIATSSRSNSAHRRKDRLAVYRCLPGRDSQKKLILQTDWVLIPLLRRQVGAALEGVVRQPVTPIRSLAVDDTHEHYHFGSGLAKLLGFDLYTRWHDMRCQWIHLPRD